MRSLERYQVLTFIAAFLGWTLDAFDFFTVSFALPYIAEDFNMKPSDIAASITVTLFLRPVGALIFGILADKYGRKYPLMVDIILYSAVELASGFAPNFQVFVALRAIFGIAMGGEWGLGAALAMEALPPEARGLFSGILQQGYPTGYIIAAIFYYAVISTLGWRAMFWIGSFPALVVVFMRFFVPESKAWEKTRETRSTDHNMFHDVKKVFKEYWLRIIHTILLMAGFGFTSHGTQDLFPTFLKTQLSFSPEEITVTTIIANIGSIIGGTTCGYLSQYLGRRKMVVASMILAGAFLPLIAIPINKPLVTFGSFVVYFFVQGAFGVVPAHLNELSPPAYRGTFPGLTYQLGTLIASSSAQVEAKLGEVFPKNGLPNYGLTIAIMSACAMVVVIVFMSTGGEKKHVNFMEESEISLEDNREVVETKNAQ
ncbi:putative metabolite transport, membrane protein [Gigaspora rosea]|uniref:Putative metabolite transport, membrane protein n=1 Tax=Gigaspora rosea TaxID=44941 RepID=A0A397W066_9GLOM|nr:putative metabolite transport, membrane protein [Gigaspora rosea]